MNYFSFYNPPKKRIKQSIVFFLFALFLLVASCSNYHCKEPMYVPMYAAFYSDLDTNQITLTDLEIKGVNDRPVERDPSQKFIMLPLKKFDSLKDDSLETTFSIQSGYKFTENEEVIERKFFDTLTIKHINTQEFVSAECGCRTIFRLDTVVYTRRNVAEVVLANKSVKSSIVNNPNEKHIKIYFRNH